MSRENSDGFTTLYNVGWPAAMDGAKTVLPSTPDAEDAAQAVFVRVWQKGAGGWRRIQNPRDFFFMAGRNEAVSRSRSRLSLSHPPGDLTCTRNAPDEGAAASELFRIAEDIIADLPPRCAAVMRLVALKGYTQKESADRLGISVKAVEKQLERGRRLSRHIATQKWPRYRHGSLLAFLGGTDRT